MSITIKEIAKIAGVARATVDRAIKGKSGIKEETKAEILAIVKKYDFKPNTIGKALVYLKKKHTIGIILNSEGNDFFKQVIVGIETAIQEIADYGFDNKIIFLKGYSISEQLIAIEEMQTCGVKSLIITPINDSEIQQKLKVLEESNINVVAINSDIKNVKKLCYVGCDYLKSGRTAGSLVGLLSVGKANVLVVTGSLCMQGHKDRVSGFIEKIQTEYKDIKIVKVIENNDDDVESYAKVKNEIMAYSAISYVCVTAGGVKGACVAIKECNPSISVVSFDDTEEIKGLIADDSVKATITQQPFEQGYNSVKVLFNYVVNKVTPQSNIFTELSIKIKENI